MIDTQQQIQMRLTAIDQASRRPGVITSAPDIAAFIQEAQAIYNFIIPPTSTLDIPNAVSLEVPAPTPVTIAV